MEIIGRLFQKINIYYPSSQIAFWFPSIKVQMMTVQSIQAPECLYQQQNIQNIKSEILDNHKKSGNHNELPRLIIKNMRLFNNKSIKNKLQSIILLTSAIVLLLASTAFLIHDLITFRRSMVADLFVLADLIGINSSAGLIYLDKIAAEENIAGLKANSHILFTHIFDKNGVLFASYIREDLDQTSLPKYSTINDYYSHIDETLEYDKFKNMHFFHGNHVDIFKPIIFKEKMRGTVYIQADLDVFNKRLYWEGSIVVGVMLISLILAFILASWFQRVITVPIYSLLKTMKAVSTQKNYSLRVHKTLDDELGNLIAGFNDMLAQIEVRDTQLAQYRDHLEEKVNQRTVELAEARDQAMAANKAKSTFLANMSHELRTPLNGVLGYAQILAQDKSLNAQQKDGISVIQRSGEYLLTLISDILDLSKIEAGKIEIYPSEFHLGQFLKELAELFQMRALQKEINFTYEFSKYLPTGICADNKRLRQVLINLLSNSIKFTKHGTVSFTVDYCNDQFHFKVADTGIGIAEEELKTIFLPFHQVGDSNYKAEGTGLGLSITQKLVEMMGGELHVESMLEKGSTFWITLDLPKVSGFVEEQVVKEPVIIGYQLPTQPVSKESPYQILIVDDRWENRAMLVNLLTPLGFEVIEAVNGQDGLNKACELRPDFIVMDLMMPVMDGFQATRQIREIQELTEVPIIAASASVFEYHRQESLKVGCNDFLSKPIYNNELLAFISKHLDLEWIYEEIPENVSTEALTESQEQILVILSAEDYSILFELATMGDIDGIVELIEKLEQVDTQLTPFANKVRKLANDFEIDKLQEFIQKYQPSSL